MNSRVILYHALLCEYFECLRFRLRFSKHTQLYFIITLVLAFTKYWQLTPILLLLELLLEFPQLLNIDESNESYIMSFDMTDTHIKNIHICDSNMNKLYYCGIKMISGTILMRINMIKDKRKREKVFNNYCKFYNLQKV